MKKRLLGLLLLCVFVLSMVPLTCAADVPCEHSYGAWETQQAATCTTAGKKVRICSKCGDVDQGTIPATGHSYGDVTPGVYPYFRIDSELGLLIGNAQIAYDPEKGLGIWPYEWGE